MPKKKATPTEDLTETPINEENMEAPKPKKKRVISEKQKANFEKLQEANRIRYEARRKAKQELGEQPKPNKKNANEEILENKEEDINNEIKKKTKKKIIKEDTSSEEEAPTIIKKKQRKKRKPKIVIEQDSSSEEEEIIIRRSRKPKSIKQKQQQEGYVNDKIEDKEEEINNEIKEEAPIEKEKIEKTPTPLKEYTHTQILRGLGL